MDEGTFLFILVRLLFSNFLHSPLMDPTLFINGNMKSIRYWLMYKSKNTRKTKKIQKLMLKKGRPNYILYFVVVIVYGRHSERFCMFIVE